jgi:hypothetical protein
MAYLPFLVLYIAFERVQRDAARGCLEGASRQMGGVNTLRQYFGQNTT